MRDPVVEIRVVPGGYGWYCHACRRSAGLPPYGPITDAVLPSGEALTAMEFVTRAAQGHATKVCTARSGR